MSQTKPSQRRGLLAQAVDLALLPLRLAVSPLARRAYLSTFLLFLASIALLLVSSVTYILFYYAYVPHAAVSVPIYLQYAHKTPGTKCPPAQLHGSGTAAIVTSQDVEAGVHPFGTGILLPALASDQKYDVEVVLHMPRSPTNMKAGNFMVDLALLAPGIDTGSDAQKADKKKTPEIDESSESVVVRARRPAMLRYSSFEVDLLRKLVAAPWYALGWAHERERVDVGMLEDIEFTVPRNRNLRGAAPGVPDRVRVLLESKEILEVYSVTVEIRARLRGLRWIMYKHRILSFVAFTGAFYTVVMGTCITVYVGLSVWQFLKEEGEEEDGVRKGKAIKQEAEDDDLTIGSLSDTSRTFPSRPGHEPLKYTGRGRQFANDEEVVIKKEEDEDIQIANIAPLEADDEDNGDDYYDSGLESWRDSGIGTSREDPGVRNARRRKRNSANVATPPSNEAD